MPAAQTLPKRPLGALATARAVIAKEGARGLYAGLAPALARHIFYTGAHARVHGGAPFMHFKRKPAVAVLGCSDVVCACTACGRPP